MNMLLLITLLPTAASAGDGTPAGEWSRRESSIRSVNLTWRITRDSRSAGFGFAAADTSPEVWRLQLSDGQVWRHGERVAEVMRDGRMRPHEVDPDRARQHFWHVLFEGRLAGVQAMPFRQAVITVDDEQELRSGPPWGRLESAVFEVPMWCAHPMLHFGEAQPHPSADDDEPGLVAVLLLQTGTSPKATREIHVERDAPCRILKVIDVIDGRTTLRCDVAYADGSDVMPSTCLVQYLGSSGHPVAFLEATRTGLQTNAEAERVRSNPAPTHLGDGAPVVRDEYRHARQKVRAALDLCWVILPAGGGCALLLLAARRLRSSTGGPAASVRLGSRYRKALVQAAIVTATGLLLARMSPAFDPSLGEAYQRLREIQQRAMRLHSEGTASTVSGSRLPQLLTELSALDEELTQAGARRAGPWRSVAVYAQHEAAAWRDVARLCKSELPAFLRDRVPVPQRARAIELTLARLDDHIAGVSPYITRPKPVEDQEELATLAHRMHRSISPGTAAATLLNVAGVTLMVLICRRRGRATG